MDALIAATAEMVRVLKPSGSIFINLGDKYAQNVERSRNGEGSRRTTQTGGLTGSKPYMGAATFPRPDYSVPTKSLCLIPERFRVAAVDRLGLIARAVIVWSKPSGLPESVTDRVRRSHEDWVHLTKRPRYFSAVDEIREPYEPSSLASYARGGAAKAVTGVHPSSSNGSQKGGISAEWSGNPLGKLPSSVWTIASQPLRVPDHLGIDHFAAFPLHWPRQLIRGWSPGGVCVGCGEGRRPVSTTVRTHNRKGRQVNVLDRPERGLDTQGLGWESQTVVTGYACGCPHPTAPTRPAVILDPFGGTGTTALAAKVLGRHGITVDMSADYCRLAAWRTTDPGELARAAQVEKPPVELDGQDALFG